MVSLEQLKALKTKLGITKEETPDVTESKAVNPQSAEQKNKFVEPVAIPCKNYDDEKGHFAYIDANTHQPSHVNLATGKPYTQDDVNRLSLQKATKNMSEAEQKLTWQQVISKDTLYDQFGSPVFTAEEITRALTAPQNPEAPSFETSSGKDAFGLS